MLLAGQAVLILSARFAFDVELPIGWLAMPLAVTAASNLLLHRLTTAVGARPLLGWLLALDTLTLTDLLTLTGGGANHFSVLYLVQITPSTVVLNKRWTWALGTLSVLRFAVLFPLHFSVSVFEAHHTIGGFSTHLIGMWIAFAAAALVVTIFIGKVSEALRRREQEVLSLQGRIARQERLASIVTLAAGAEPIGETPAFIELREVLEGVRRGLAPRAREHLHTEVSGNLLRARLPVAAARQALAALVNNAFEASRNGSAAFLVAEGGDRIVRFRVVDTGCGMPPETLNRIAEPLFSTKDAGRNMGLGTFLARVFAERLGGRLVFESQPGTGTKVLLELPSISND